MRKQTQNNANFVAGKLFRVKSLWFLVFKDGANLPGVPRRR